jgi:hypothetical protein
MASLDNTKLSLAQAEGFLVASEGLRPAASADMKQLALEAARQACVELRQFERALENELCEPPKHKR